MPILHRIKSQEDVKPPQEESDRLAVWVETWLVKFCVVLRTKTEKDQPPPADMTALAAPQNNSQISQRRTTTDAFSRLFRDDGYLNSYQSSTHCVGKR